MHGATVEGRPPAYRIKDEGGGQRGMVVPARGRISLTLLGAGLIRLPLSLDRRDLALGLLLGGVAITVLLAAFVGVGQDVAAGVTVGLLALLLANVIVGHSDKYSLGEVNTNQAEREINPSGPIKLSNKQLIALLAHTGVTAYRCHRANL